MGELEAAIKDIVEEHGCEMVYASWQKEGRQKLLSVSVDKDGGITLDDCEVISRGISEYLDAHDELTPHNFSLEVGSPGPDRPLTKIEHYRRFTGEKAVINLGGGKKRVLRIAGADDGGSISFISMDKESVTLDFKDIKSARLKPE